MRLQVLNSMRISFSHMPEPTDGNRTDLLGPLSLTLWGQHRIKNQLRPLLNGSRLLKYHTTWFWDLLQQT